MSFDDERSGTNLEVWRGGGCGGERVNRKEKRGAGMLAFPSRKGLEVAKFPFYVMRFECDVCEIQRV